MASLKKRGKYYYVRFSKYQNGKEHERVLSLKTKWKEIAQKNLSKLEKLEDEDLIDPFHPDFDIEIALDPQLDKVPVTLEEAYKRFLKSKQHLSPYTIVKYKDNIGHFFRYTGCSKIHPKRLSRSLIEQFLFRGGIAVASILANARTLKVFLNYMLDHGWVDQNPMDNIELPEKEKKIKPKMITKEEFDILLDTFTEYQEIQRHKPTHRRHKEQLWFKPMMAIYFYTGMRLHEVAYKESLNYSGLKAENIIDNELFYLGPTKRQKERYIPISKHIKPFLNEYLEHRGKMDPEDYIFINFGGRYDGEPIKGKTVRDEFNKYCEMAGISSDRTIHGIRHQRITAWLKDGFTLKEAAEMAGHSSTQVTESTYSHLLYSDLVNKMKKIEGE